MKTLKTTEKPTKIKLLVLDAFTNGHEAALRFIRKMKWKKENCDIIFCGTHQALLERLSAGPGYGVVPVYNSIAGEVSEVTKHIWQFREFGYEFSRISRLELQINHCLLAPKHIIYPDELTHVVSHEKAIAQCGKYLDKIGIRPDHRSKQDSTGNAAKYVSRLGPEMKIGAIAPKNAAKAYGLNVLKERIQDTKRNITTFHLLQNRAYIKPEIVGIIGINGGLGQVMQKFFEGIGCKVIGSDLKNPTAFTNEKVMKASSVVIFAVPTQETVRVINSVIRYSNEDQLLMDVTSVKKPAMEAMLKGKAQVLGLHPMFAPEVGFDGQTIVACPARLDNKNGWATWVLNVLARTGSKIRWSSGDKHDKYMARAVQGSPHLATITNAALIMETGTSVEESLTFTSPFYRIMFSLMGRLLSQNADLYSGILMENPETVPMLAHKIKIEQKLMGIIKRKDVKAFRKFFNEIKAYFGDNPAKEANELFLRLLSVTKTLYGKNTAVLEFTKTENQPGLLERVARVFRKREINLTGINSVFLDDKRIQFTISFGQPRTSDVVRRALEEIEGWTEPLVKVIS